MKWGLFFLGVVFCAYWLHRLIRRFINPRDSANHFLLFFVAHFIGLFMLSFFVGLFIIKFSPWLLGK